MTSGVGLDDIAEGRNGLEARVDGVEEDATLWKLGDCDDPPLPMVPNLRFGGFGNNVTFGEDLRNLALFETTP
ncbi:hypothetical protein FOPE_04892 [Fonsecaea pedrosoi]|nr:hypothetical protein FOPE_04892 [Fonsecaea pedrosoi]